MIHRSDFNSFAYIDLFYEYSPQSIIMKLLESIFLLNFLLILSASATKQLSEFLTKIILEIIEKEKQTHDICFVNFESQFLEDVYKNVTRTTSIDFYYPKVVLNEIHLSKMSKNQRKTSLFIVFIDKFDKVIINNYI